MNLTQGKLTIRDATVDDAAILIAWWNDGAVMAHAGFPNGLGISEREVVELVQQDSDCCRRLILEYEGLPIGEMSYRMPEETVAEIGIKICEVGRQNRGAGTKYLQMLMDYLFMQMGYGKIVLDTNLNNERARHVYEKLGFRKTATRLDSWTNQIGEVQSSVEYELSREDYWQNEARRSE